MDARLAGRGEKVNSATPAGSKRAGRFLRTIPIAESADPAFILGISSVLGVNLGTLLAKAISRFGMFRRESAKRGRAKRDDESKKSCEVVDKVRKIANNECNEEGAKCR